MCEAGEVPLMKRVEEGTVPFVEPDLTDHVGDQHSDNAANEHCKLQPMTRPPKRAKQLDDFGNGALAFISRGRRFERSRIRGARRLAACVDATVIINIALRAFGVRAGHVPAISVLHLCLHIAGPPTSTAPSVRRCAYLSYQFRN